VGVGRALGLVGDFSRPVLLIDWLLTLCLVGGFRMSIRVVGEANDKSRRDESFDIRIAKQNAPNLPLAIAVSATPNARLVIR